MDSRDLVDLLTIQKEIHSGLFAVMDGSTAGDGPGPRTMRPKIKNKMLASADQVAIDAVGFGPLKPIQKLLFHTPLVYVFVAGSEAYHDWFRWPVKDRLVFNEWREKTAWGQLFNHYGSVKRSAPDQAVLV